MRRARESALAALVAAVLAGLVAVACAGPVSPGTPPVTSGEVPFRDEGATAQSGHRGGPAVTAAADGGGTRITVFQGEQRSGGFAIRVERVTRSGDELRVHARLTEPGPGAIVTMALTSPAHTVVVDAAPATVVLLDQNGAERARAARR